MNAKSSQGSLDLVHNEILIIDKPIYFRNEKSDIGVISQLALEPGSLNFSAIHENENLFKLTHETGVSFLAELKKGTGSKKGTYQIKGCVQRLNTSIESYADNVSINGVGESGWTLRPAQSGAIYSLLSHWSLTKDVATVVLPTGTGKQRQCLSQRLQIKLKELWLLSLQLT
ncbi:hypothetical protein [Oceanospirillum sediminis]|uniref:hypothetical protein n=1 Tax=Oceanospirillum sediminis TaxID=2760088 RepID=UPI001C71B3B3|nr:hypothetical protein [Oceanospirillum sediminis]